MNVKARNTELKGQKLFLEPSREKILKRRVATFNSQLI
jgi:hypothetical protein